MKEIDINDERSVRLAKAQVLREAGKEPYPVHAERSHLVNELTANFDQLSQDETAVTAAGRIRLLRRHGGSTFARLQDESGTVQIFFSKKSLGEDAYTHLKLIDVGDFLSVTGTLMLTKTGEQTLHATSYSVLSKSLQPLPDKFHGLKDEEYRYRHRYVDLIVNDEVRGHFRKRSAFVASLRNFLSNEGFLEVETPILEQIPGGAEAEPFITHHNALDVDFYLRISLELHLKRLIVGGYEKIFEIGKVFRNEGLSTQHLQEFTLMEFYWAYADNARLMEFVQRMYQHIIETTFGTLQIKYKNETLDFSGEWPRLDYRSLFLQHSGIDLTKVTDVTTLRKAVQEQGIDVDLDPQAGYGRLVDQVYKKTVRPNLVQPCFLINHPTAVSPLAKQHPDQPEIVDRHQVLIAGAEVGNGFSELNDPVEQRRRFEEQMKLREEGDAEAQMIDEDFLKALEHGMPPTGGFGVGIDRLFAILTDSESIRDVVFFPLMRPKQDDEHYEE